MSNEWEDAPQVEQPKTVTGDDGWENSTVKNGLTNKQIDTIHNPSEGAIEGAGAGAAAKIAKTGYNKWIKPAEVTVQSAPSEFNTTKPLNSSWSKGTNNWLRSRLEIQQAEKGPGRNARLAEKFPNFERGAGAATSGLPGAAEEAPSVLSRLKSLIPNAVKTTGTVGANALRFASPILAGAGAVEGYTDMRNRAAKDDYIGAGISAMGGVGSAISPWVPEVGVPVALGAQGVNYLRDNPDIFKNSNEMLNNAATQGYNTFNNGGLVHLAEGGDIKKSPASIAGTLQEVGTVQGPSLASMAKDYTTQLPQKVADNLAHQNDITTNSLGLDPKKGVYIADAGKFNEFMNEMPNMMGSTGSEGYLPHTELNPNPLVGTRFEARDLGGLAPVKEMNLEDIRGHMLHTKPWDLTGRNQEIISVSKKPLTNPIVTHGGQPYARDLEHMANDIGGASSNEISGRIQKITDIASQEGEKLGGTGQVTMTPSTMGKFSENFAKPTFETYWDLFKQAEHSPEALDKYANELRSIKVKTKAGNIVNPFADLKDLDNPEVLNQFDTNSDLRKAFIANQQKKANQKILGVNAEDISAAHTDPNLVGLPTGYAGHTMIEMRPGAELRPSANQTYDTDFSGQYLGSIGHTPAAVLLNKSYQNIYGQIKKLFPEASDNVIHARTLGALYTRNHGVSDLVNDEMINRVGAYHEAVKQNKINPLDTQGALQYLAKPGAYKEGGEV